MSKLSVLNPFKPLLTEQEASIAARAGAVGALLTAASGVIGAVRLYLQQDRMLALMLEGAKLQNMDPEVARQVTEMMESILIYLTLGASVGVTIAYLVFGLIQWRRRTKLIPLFMFLISAWGVTMAVLGLFMTRTPEQAAVMPPGWLLAVDWALSILLLLLFWAGFRGGSWLQKLREAVSTSQDPPGSSAR